MVHLFRNAGSMLGVALVALASALLPTTARASHALGADMSYVSVSPGVYYVQYRFYRDCSGIPAPDNFTVNYAATGCAAGGNNTGGTIILNPRLSQVGNPYCPAQNAMSPCDSVTSTPSNGYPNYQIFTYGGILTLGTSAAATCSEWILSTYINARPDTRNLGFGTDLYTHVVLNNRDVPDDSSPAFSTVGGLQPLAVMYENTPIRYNGSVVDPDGDSLVYSMQAPLSALNTPIAYVNGHSLQNPIRLAAGSPPVTVDQQGTLSFTPGSIIGGSNNDVDNKFVFVVQVDAYRRINGVVTKLSTIRRELAGVIVRPPAHNDPPSLNGNTVSVTTAAGTQSQAYGDTIFAYVGEALTVDVPLRDANGDSVLVQLPAAQAPSGSALATAGYAQVPGLLTEVTARITWTPQASHARAQGHTFFLRVIDNGCPVSTSSFYPLTVMVAPLRPLGTAAAVTRRQASAAPNPFTTAVRLTVPAGTTGVEISDLTGRVLHRLPIAVGQPEVTWHAPAALPAGVYVARYASPAGAGSVRLVKE